MANQIQLDTLNPREFLNVVPNRKAKIESAPASPLPKDYAVNKLARSLHPEVQYLKISEIKEHNEDAKSFTLIPDKSKETDSCAYFSAGQYLSISLNIEGVTVSKPYSICSGPNDALNNSYTITVKRSENGFASEYILNNWKIGGEVTASGPEGSFTYEPLRDAKHIIGLAGGSGITPFHSLACAIADGIEDCKLTLLYGSRDEDSILLKEELEAIASKCDNVKIIHVLSDKPAEGCENGFITADLIKKYAPSGEYSIFLCGPQAMYDFVDKEIEKLQLAPKWIRHELFGEYKNPSKEADYPKDKLHKTFNVSVKIRGEVKVISCNSNETLLTAMERAGIAAPSRCRSGECGFCHSRLNKGEVYVPSSVDGRRLADYKFGFIHPCCSFPISDVEIEVATK